MPTNLSPCTATYNFSSCLRFSFCRTHSIPPSLQIFSKACQARHLVVGLRLSKVCLCLSSLPEIVDDFDSQAFVAGTHSVFVAAKSLDKLSSQSCSFLFVTFFSVLIWLSYTHDARFEMESLVCLYCCLQLCARGG